MDAFRIVKKAFRIVMDAGIPPMRRISQFVGPCEDLDLDLRLLTTIKPGVERTTELLGGVTLKPKKLRIVFPHYIVKQ